MTREELKASMGGRQCNCAAGPWNYDMSQAPDESEIGILLLDRKRAVWLGFEQDSWPVEGAAAWAELRLPEEE